MKCQPRANNNRKAVVVCARHVVKQPSKRMRASIYIYFNCVLIVLMYSSSVIEGLTLANLGGAKFRIWGSLAPKVPPGLAAVKNPYLGLLTDKIRD